MWPYWLLFCAPALISLVGHGERRVTGAFSERRFTLPWVVAALTLTVAIGIRYEVGGDWPNYLLYLDNVTGSPLADVLAMPDPGYQFLNWVSVQFGWGILGVNLAAGAIFSYGLVRFCVSLPRPWLAITASVPYLVIVVGMGYTRQAVALSLALLGILSLRHGSTRRFTAYVIVGATFHKSAILLLPLVAFGSARPIRAMLWIGPITGVAYVLLLRDSVDSIYVNYIEAQYASDGALVRVAMNAIPAAVFLAFWKKYRLPPRDAVFWRWCALLSLGLLVAVLLTPATTAIDRAALYLLPLQLVVFAGVPRGQFGRYSDSLLRGTVVAYYGVVLFVWMNYATHAPLWLPYQTFSLDDLF
jgi:hypothetical protein